MRVTAARFPFLGKGMCYVNCCENLPRRKFIELVQLKHAIPHGPILGYESSLITSRWCYHPKSLG